MSIKSNKSKGGARTKSAAFTKLFNSATYTFVFVTVNNCTILLLTKNQRGDVTLQACQQLTQLQWDKI